MISFSAGFISLYWSSESLVFLTIETPGILGCVGSWTSCVVLAELYRSCSIAPVSLSIGPAQTSREASGISQSIVELDDPGSIVCSVYLVIPSIGSAGVYSVFQDILILIWTCWNCYDPWVIPTVRYSYNRCSSRYHNPCFKYYILNFYRNCCYISINLFCILFCFYFGPSIL